MLRELDKDVKGSEVFIEKQEQVLLEKVHIATSLWAH